MERVCFFSELSDIQKRIFYLSIVEAEEYFGSDASLLHVHESKVRMLMTEAVVTGSFGIRQLSV